MQSILQSQDCYPHIFVPSDSLNLYILFGNCTGDELETIINGLRNEVKSAGQQDTRDNCWSFFIDRVRKQLKVVLCFSPVGTTLRVRARKFPAIVNCTSIDWFHEWPDEALDLSVQGSCLKWTLSNPKSVVPSVASWHLCTKVSMT
jgi:dynein heavy chain